MNEAQEVKTSLEVPNYLIGKKPSNNRVKIFIYVLLAVLIVGGTVLATKAWDPIWSPLRMKPESVVAKMVEKMKTIKTLGADINLAIENQDKNSLLISLKMNRNQKEDPIRQSLGFIASIKQKNDSISLSGESIVVGENGYIRINEVPLILASFLGSMQNQWFRYNQDEETNESNKKSFAQLQEIFKNSQWYIIEKELKDEKVNNITTYHYLVSVNRSAIEKALAEYIKQSQEDIKNHPSFGEINFEDLSSSILEKTFDQIGEIKAEIWIGKKDYYLRKVQMQKTFNAQSLNIPTDDVLNLSAEIIFSEFNQEFNIEEPKEFKDLKDVFGNKLPLQIGL